MGVLAYSGTELDEAKSLPSPKDAYTVFGFFVSVLSMAVLGIYMHVEYSVNLNH